MHIIEIKEWISDKIHSYLKSNKIDLPLIIEVNISQDYLDNILIWLKGKLYVLEEENLLENINFEKIYLKLQLINNLPVGWKISYSDQELK
jgi:hypothetical protein